MVTNEYASQKQSDKELRSEMKTLTYRHIAWMTALRHAMRVLKPWEITSSSRTNAEWGIKPPEQKSTLEEDLKPYFSENDLNYISNKDNKPTALLYLQSHHLRALKEQGIIWEFSFLELESEIKSVHFTGQE